MSEAALSRALVALRPWLPHVVLAGGWAHRLFPHHPRAQRPDFPPLMTLDADLVAPGHPPQLPDMRRLLEAAGFVTRLSGEERPPVSEYVLEDEGGFSLEFITPLRGGAVGRGGASRATVAVGGVTAQRLRHVELLELSPWSLRVGREQGFGADALGLRLRVAHPAAYLAQKLLVLDKRRRARAEKDVLYVHDTLLMFADALDVLAEDWRRMCSELPRPTAAAVARLARTRFALPDGVVNGAARVAAETGRSSPPSPAAIAAACRAGLAAVFGA